MMSELHCLSDQSVIWNKIDVRTTYSLANTSVWRLNVLAYKGFESELFQLLHPDEMQKASQFYFEKDRSRYVIAKGMLRMLLSKFMGVAPASLLFTTGKNQKPQLHHTYERVPHFNISHSGDCVLIAIGEDEIGVDVEVVNHSFDYSAILPYCFTPAEIDFVFDSLTPAESFYLLWTRKESVLKATAIGVTGELTSISCLDGSNMVSGEAIGSENDWFVTSFVVDELHVGSVTLKTKSLLNYFSLEPSSGRLF